jgi:NRAMP (natural resistance-associated macrophage protein)-like metal ion transporter
VTRRAKRSRHHHQRLHIRGFGYFRRLGPGLVTGAADDDPSGIGTYSQVGAQFRYGMVWTAPLSFPLAAAVQEAAARIGLASGKGLATCIKDHLNKWVLWPAVALVCVANIFNIGADLGSMAASFRLVVHIPYQAALIAFGVAIVAIEVVLTYRVYAKFLRWLCLSLGAYIVVLGTANVKWREVVHSTFVPALHGRAGVGALIAILGTTISPYLFFWQASEEVEEEEAHGDPVDDEHIRAMRVDVIAGMFSAVAVMFAIMVASAATLGAAGIRTVGTADQAARALAPIAGHAAGLLFALGIIGTGALAVPVLAGSSAYALSESFGWSEGLSRRFREAEGFYGIIVAAVGVGVVFGFTHLNPIRALYYSAVLNGLAAPPLLFLMLVLSHKKGAVGGRTGGVISDVLVGIAFVIMTALPIWYLLS